MLLAKSSPLQWHLQNIAILIQTYLNSVSKTFRPNKRSLRNVHKQPIYAIDEEMEISKDIMLNVVQIQTTNNLNSMELQLQYLSISYNNCKVENRSVNILFKFSFWTLQKKFT